MANVTSVKEARKDKSGYNLFLSAKIPPYIFYLGTNFGSMHLIPDKFLGGSLEKTLEVVLNALPPEITTKKEYQKELTERVTALIFNKELCNPGTDPAAYFKKAFEWLYSKEMSQNINEFDFVLMHEIGRCVLESVEGLKHGMLVVGANGNYSKINDICCVVGNETAHMYFDVLELETGEDTKLYKELYTEMEKVRVCHLPEDATETDIIVNKCLGAILLRFMMVSIENKSNPTN